VSRNLILGLDPGGKGAFGWCISQDSDRLPLKIENCGVEDHAQGALAAVLKCVGGADQILGAGIDSPLYWIPKGDRETDKLLRKEIRHRHGNPNVVMAVNALRGACLVQGVLIGQLLRERFKGVRITEAHPKALLWLLRIVLPGNRTKEVTTVSLSPWAVFIGSTNSEHERDASLAAVTAWAMLHSPQGWADIAKLESIAMYPWNSPVSYWMPIKEEDLKHKRVLPQPQ
jgi:hypothetical protein